MEGADRMDEYYGIEGRFIVLVGGRLGLRRGELAHMTEEWIDWRRSMICIPRHEPCGCGACTQMAESEAAHNEAVTVVGSMERRWQPKTDAAIREVPFDFSARVELVLERFFDRWDAYPHSCQSINRRLKRAAELADEISPERVYPHCLRATASSYHAGRGLGVLPLQSMFGWSDLETPMNYVKQSGENTARELNRVHSR